MKKLFTLLITLTLVSAASFIRCTDDENFNPKAGNLILKLTDAASDDEDIKGIYLSVSSIKVNGKPIRHFSPQVVEVSNLKKGRTALLVSRELPAKAYDQVSLVLSPGSGGPENLPGCYLVKNDNTKHSLVAGSTSEIEIPVAVEFELFPGKDTKLVLDFDLRKAIVRKASGTPGYSFVSNGELAKAVRVVNEEQASTITGEVKARITEDTQIYVLLYKKGEFQAATEGTGTGKSKVLFARAVSSAKVESDGSYQLSFIEEGDYEIHIASYKKNKDDVYSFHGFLTTTSKRTGFLLNHVSVTAGSDLELNIEIFSL